jgi:hypothetical protein
VSRTRVAPPATGGAPADDATAVRSEVRWLLGRPRCVGGAAPGRRMVLVVRAAVGSGCARRAVTLNGVEAGATMLVAVRVAVVVVVDIVGVGVGKGEAARAGDRTAVLGEVQARPPLHLRRLLGWRGGCAGGHGGPSEAPWSRGDPDARGWRSAAGCGWCGRSARGTVLASVASGCRTSMPQVGGLAQARSGGRRPVATARVRCSSSSRVSGSSDGGWASSTGQPGSAPPGSAATAPGCSTSGTVNGATGGEPGPPHHPLGPVAGGERGEVVEHPEVLRDRRGIGRPAGPAVRGASREAVVGQRVQRGLRGPG